MHACALIILALYSIVICIIFPKWTVDDAYITFRYAENLAHHLQLSWNVGEAPVEGYTGVVLPVVLALLMKIGVSPVAASHTIGLLSFAITGVLIFHILVKLGVQASVSFLRFNIPIRHSIVVLFFTAPFLYTHAFSGLETLLFMACVTGTVYTLILYLESGKNNIVYIFLAVVLLTGLTRPEGFLLALISFVAVGFIKSRYHRDHVHGFIGNVIMIYFLPLLVYGIWKWIYYGQLLPNAYYAKEYDGIINKESLRALFLFFKSYLAGPVLSAIIFLLIYVSFLIKKYRERKYQITISHMVIFCISIVFIEIGRAHV